MVFIDGAYFGKILKQEFNSPRIHWGRLADEISAGAELLDVYYYDCLPYLSNSSAPEDLERYLSHKNFLTRTLGLTPHYHVREGTTVRRICDNCRKIQYVQKAIDVLLTTDILTSALTGDIHQAVLLTGDGDFIPAINAVKTADVEVGLYHGNNCSGDLLKVVNWFRKIDLEFINAVKLEY
jgi:uncharacterized LabA/DUF88 family protein